MFSKIKKWLKKMQPMDRIYFVGNPYPYGHKIIAFTWSGRLEKDKGLFFDFELKSDDYYAEDDSEPNYDEGDGGWDSKIVWSNYHSCRMSSTFWEGNGILVGSPKNKMDFRNLLDKTLVADQVPSLEDYDFSKAAFNIYLLGHDGCADHKITFIKQHDRSTFDIEWNGKIALVYAADYDLKHSFKSKTSEVRFEGIYLDKKISIQENWELLKDCVVDHEDFQIVDD